MWIRDSALHRARALLSLLLDPFLVVVVEGSRKQEMHEEEEEEEGVAVSHCQCLHVVLL